MWKERGEDEETAPTLPASQESALFEEEDGEKQIQTA